MEWIFIDLGVGSLALLTAQLLEYVVSASRTPRGNVHLDAFTQNIPPGDVLPRAEAAVWYDQAA
jgi:hypothetical protein